MPKHLTPSQKRVLLLSSLGGVLEFYDFIIYIFLAPYIEKTFFAHSSSYVATLKTLAVFSVGYLVRPLGGMVFSHFGDRSGRKVVFLSTVIFMALPSFAIGFLPSTAQIGVMAPILLLLFRLMQGLALGGEIPAAITFVSEHVETPHRAFALSTLFFGINLGLLLGSMVTTLLTAVLSEADILAYGWRIPFIIGGFFGIGSLLLRSYLHETAAFRALAKKDVQRLPLVTLLHYSWREVLQGFLLVSLGSVTVFFYLYWPTYLHQYMHYDYAELMRVNTLGTLLLNIMIIFGGLLSDRFGFRRIYILSALTLVVFTYPLFLLFDFNNMMLVKLSYLLFAVIFGLIPSSYSSILCGLFSTRVRYTGIAMSYNFAYAIVGGLSPVVCTIMIQVFNTAMAPAFYVIFIAALASLACYLGRNSRDYEQT